MARCDQGYLCIVCGEEVENIEDSGLYLRYIIGEVQEAELQEAEHTLQTLSPGTSLYESTKARVEIFKVARYQ